MSKFSYEREVVGRRRRFIGNQWLTFMRNWQYCYIFMRENASHLHVALPLYTMVEVQVHRWHCTRRRFRYCTFPCNLQTQFVPVVHLSCARWTLVLTTHSDYAGAFIWSHNTRHHTLTYDVHILRSNEEYSRCESTVWGKHHPCRYAFRITPTGSSNCYRKVFLKTQVEICGSQLWIGMLNGIRWQ